MDFTTEPENIKGRIEWIEQELPRLAKEITELQKRKINLQKELRTQREHLVKEKSKEISPRHK